MNDYNNHYSYSTGKGFEITLLATVTFFMTAAQTFKCQMLYKVAHAGSGNCFIAFEKATVMITKHRFLPKNVFTVSKSS